jgi:hypothetical protein
MERRASNLGLFIRFRLGKPEFLAKPDKGHNRQLAGRIVPLAEVGLVEAGNRRSLGEIARWGEMIDALTRSADPDWDECV